MTFSGLLRYNAEVLINYYITKVLEFYDIKKK